MTESNYGQPVHHRLPTGKLACGAEHLDGLQCFRLTCCRLELGEVTCMSCRSAEGVSLLRSETFPGPVAAGGGTSEAPPAGSGPSHRRIALGIRLYRVNSGPRANGAGMRGALGMALGFAAAGLLAVVLGTTSPAAAEAPHNVTPYIVQVCTRGPVCHIWKCRKLVHDRPLYAFTSCRRFS